MTNHDWHKRYYGEIEDVYYLKFIWKRSWIQQPLKEAALYIGRGQIVCIKQVQGIRDHFLHNCHPYYQTSFSDWQKYARQEDKTFSLLIIHTKNKIMYL